MNERPLKFFVELESQVWEALVAGDADADRALLSSDFLGSTRPGSPTGPNMPASSRAGRVWRHIPSPMRD